MATPRLENWTTFDETSGLPTRKTLAVLADATGVWVGTEKGLARIEGDRVTRLLDQRQGLPYPVVTSLARSATTGDLWIGTMGGLARLSAGRIDSWTQLDSGLANDVVYGVAADGDKVWAATAAGLSSFEPRTGNWEIFDTSNTLMHEPWTYAVTADEGSVYVGVWGGGVVIRDKKTGRFREHRDPDGEMEIDLFRDDGPIHDVTSGIAIGSGLLWQSSYFGLSRYDGRRWRTWTERDSGIAASFVITLRPDGRRVWIGTDAGLSHLDGETWRTWHRLPERGWEIVDTDSSGQRRTARAEAGPAGNTIFNIEIDGERRLWLATAEGLSRATIVDGPAPSAPRTAAAVPEVRR